MGSGITNPVMLTITQGTGMMLTDAVFNLATHHIDIQIITLTLAVVQKYYKKCIIFL